MVVVDDYAEMSRALGRFLTAAGFQVITFSSGEAFLESGTATKADCLILDIYFAGLSGFELCQQLRRDSNLLPVIFISGFDDLDTQVQAQTSDAIAFFIKPFSGKDLLAAIARAIAFGRPIGYRCRVLQDLGGAVTGFKTSAG